MPLDNPVYCTVADLNRLLSAQGVTDFADNDQDGTADPDVVEDCINEATATINLYAQQRYSTSGLSTSRIINVWCTYLSACALMRRRGNVIADSLDVRCQQIMELLQQVMQGLLQIPGLPLVADLRPTWSNLAIDRRWPHSNVRVTRSNSSNAPSKLTQDFSTELFGFDN